MINEYLELAINAAKEAGNILVDHLGKVSVQEKRPRDLVTEADIASQVKIRELVESRFPEHQFLGEEDQARDLNPAKGFTWIVDPLDGTTNFVHQLRSFSVSIALIQDGEPIVGVVHDPMLNECFYGARNKGAFLNGQPIQVSNCQTLNEAMVVTGFSTSVTKESIEAKRFLEMLGKAQTIRRLGSAALNLCFLSCGRVDA
ncbi:MAG: inositol monophosphatase family protein, partial [Planctomycetota bacterium]|nr:inositol monophosphatase family protein [Planctomycetota bacterium]